MSIRSVLIGLSAFTAGCTTLPSFDSRTGVTPGIIVDVVHCELIDAVEKYPRLKTEKWRVAAEMFLQVDEHSALSATFNHLVSPAFDWGLDFETQSQRTFNQTVEYALDDISSKKCKDLNRSGISLNGRLGLDEIVGMAFESIAINEQNDDGKDRGVVYKKKGEELFGGLIQFTIAKSVSTASLIWTLSRLKGPGKLFGGKRSDTHKVAISFSSGGKDSKAATNNNIKLLYNPPPLSR